MATKKQAEIIEQMKQKITELEVERKVQNEKHQELILEMADLKRYGRDSLPAEIENPSDNIEIDQIMVSSYYHLKFCVNLNFFGRRQNTVPYDFIIYLRTEPWPWKMDDNDVKMDGGDKTNPIYW